MYKNTLKGFTMPELSLIMPAYNAGKTCEKAILSVLNCKKDIELIIVDDGSLDNTFDICSRFQKNDNRIKLYRKSNGGVSSARNYGLSVALGKYVGFLDSDDCLGKDYFNKVFEGIQMGVDLILFGYSSMSEENRTGGWVPISFENKDLLFKDLLCRAGGLNPPWNKIIKKSLVKTGFNENKRMGEDLEFCCAFLKNIKTTYVIEEELYLYNIDSTGSLTKNINIVLQSILEDIRVVSDFSNFIQCNVNNVERFYQRTEGILGSIKEKKEFLYALRFLLDSTEYMEYLLKNKPSKIKNKVIRFLLRMKLKNLLFFYLLIKRYLRGIF